MHGWFKSSSTTPIGIDVCGRDVAMAQFIETPTGPCLVAAAKVRRPSGAGASLDSATVQRLRDVMVRQGFRGNRVVATIPSLRLHADLLELPPRGPDVPIAELARAEVLRITRCENEPLQLVTWDVPPPSRATNGTLLMSIAARDAESAAVMDPLMMSGLRVTGLLPDTIAAAASALVDSNAPTDAMAIVDLDWTSASVVLVISGTPVYQRTLGECDFSRLLRLVSEELQVGEAEAMCILVQSFDDGGAAPCMPPAVERLLNAYLESVATELEFSLAFAAHRYPAHPVTQMRLTSVGATLSDIEGWMAARFDGVTPKVVRVSPTLNTPPHLASLMNDPAMCRAVGVALSGSLVQQRRLPDANVLPMRWRDEAERGRRTSLWIGGLIAEAAVLALACLLVHTFTGGDMNTTRLNAQAADDRLKDLQAANTAIRHELTALTGAREAVAAVWEKPGWSVLFGLLSEVLHGEAVLSEVELVPVSTAVGRYQLSLQGTARSQADASRLLLRLQQLPVLQDVRLVRTARAAAIGSSRDDVSFEIQCTLSDSGETNK